jgi:hypothetical protein
VTMPRGPVVDPEVRQIVARLVASGERSPAAIYRALLREIDREYEGKTGLQRPWLPTERTISRLVKELAAQSSPNQSEAWSLAAAAPDEIAVIMPVLGAILVNSAQMLSHFPNDPLAVAAIRRHRLTKGLATWIVKVATAAPSLPPYEQYIVAREYRAWELQAAQPTLRHLPPTELEALDAFLACRPWESEEAAQRYELLLEQGIVKQPIYLDRWWRSILEREQVRQRLAQLSASQSLFSQRRETIAAASDRLDTLIARLDALLANPSPDPEALKAAEAELRAIQASIAAERSDDRENATRER